jgi:hypothetical protein
VRVEPVDEPTKHAARLNRVRDPEKLFIDSVIRGGGVDHAVVHGRSNLTHVASVHPQPMPRIESFGSGHEVGGHWVGGSLPVIASGLAYAAAAVLSAMVFVGVLRAAELEQRRVRPGNFNCEAKLHYMEVSGPDLPDARERAYDQLAANCVAASYRVTELRYRDRSARSMRN